MEIQIVEKKCRQQNGNAECSMDMQDVKCRMGMHNRKAEWECGMPNGNVDMTAVLYAGME